MLRRLIATATCVTCASCLAGNAAAADDWLLWTTTGAGAGADATVHNEQGNLGSSPTLAVRYNQFPTHYMKAYLRFDLRKMEKADGAKASGRPLTAHLVLHLAGKADADHRFNVFGLIERRSYGGTREKPILGADWAENAITYANAPAYSNYGGGAFAEGKEKWEKGMLGGVNHEHVVHLGSFAVAKGDEGEVVAPLPEFTAYAEKHAKSKVVTLIICRITGDSTNATAFHSRESAAAALKAPRLAFR